MGADGRAPRHDGSGSPDREQAKTALRQAVLARRRLRPPDERSSLAGRLRDVVLAAGVLPAPGGVVACYASFGTEPGTWPLVAGLTAGGARVLLPHTHDGSDGGGVRLGWGEAHLAAHDHGPPSPGPDLGADALVQAAAVLVPALAVDTAGRRLGRGGGYYDRALADLLARRGVLPPVVALVHEDEVLDACVEPVPAAGHDVRVSHVATPDRWRRLG